jgi:hypothetical protein
LSALVIRAHVTEVEGPIIEAAAARLGELIAAASQAAWTVEVGGLGEDETPDAGPPEPICLISLATALADLEAPWVEVAANLRRRVERLSSMGPKLALITIFRHVAPDDDAVAAYRLLVRIRRLNLLAVDLSHEFGVCVVDLDRDFADIGAQALQTDFRLGGEAARRLAAWSLVRCLAANALDGIVDFDVQDQVVAVNEAAKPSFDARPFIVEAGLVRVGRGRRTQTVAAVPGGPQPSVISQLVGRAMKGQIPAGEIRARLSKSVRNGKVLDNLWRFANELAGRAAKRPL